MGCATASVHSRRWSFGNWCIYWQYHHKGEAKAGTKGKAADSMIIDSYGRMVRVTMFAFLPILMDGQRIYLKSLYIAVL